MLILIPVIIAGVLLLAVVLMYNSLIGRKNDVENAFASIDTMLKKRYDLIPNLVDAVQAYMKHEADVLRELTELRARATTGTLTPDERVDVDNRIGKAIGRVMLTVEDYPELKASANFLQLQGSLNEVEEQISAARRAFNAAVTHYNNAIEKFPTNIMAGIMSFQRRRLFEIPQQERENVDVGELFKS